ncbi:unnamed protein product [Colias eurytheme]|nr:unnamed protein product [Colias eurytheme]
MASYVDMSLDDIIQKKKRGNQNSNFRKTGKPKGPRVLNLDIIDARNKIVSKKRTQIRDAREKLAELAKQKDARLKLQQLRAKKASNKPSGSHVIQNKQRPMKTYIKRDILFTDPSRQVVYQPLQNKNLGRKQRNNQRFLEERTFASTSLPKLPIKPIVRTIENDLEIIDDPMGEDYNPAPILSNRKASLQLKIIAHNSDNQRMAIREREISPPRPPSILKKRPMAALRMEKSEEDIEKPPLEYRIIVSNLRNTVTGGDIKELFDDVGGMLESRLVRPGTAEVIYKSLEDAQRAVDLYHNRQLDGQPMNCLLVTPKTTSKSSSKPALKSSNSTVEPDLSTFHKVLFSHF